MYYNIMIVVTIVEIIILNVSWLGNDIFVSEVANNFGLMCIAHRFSNGVPIILSECVEMSTEAL